MEQAEELAMAVDTDYHALSQREETDLESLMTQCENAISNAEAFTDQLQRELSMLDGVSVTCAMWLAKHKMIGSASQKPKS